MEEVDRLSNTVIDLLDAGQHEEAEARAREIMKRFPDDPDDFERLADVQTDRGELVAAHDTYSKLEKALPSLKNLRPDEEYTTWLAARIRETAPDA